MGMEWGAGKEREEEKERVDRHSEHNVIQSRRHREDLLLSLYFRFVISIKCFILFLN